LTPIYDAGEAKAIVRYVLEMQFNLSLADILCGKVTELSADNQAELEKIMVRLEKAEPIQYVLGFAEFFGRQFHVAPGVLIPRPETAELCHLIANDGGADILDIGTGSGCIAITLALDIADSKVSAWDISDDALAIAQQNAKTLGADVSFEKRDALNISKTSNIWDVIVSNPPYICRKEAAEMEENVLKYEPDTALFVPDDDPLLFYRHIMNYAVSALRQEGRLYFEINPIYADSIVEQLQQLGFADVQKIDDQFGKTRFIKACKR
jgi:release factor glutamine methyltransferase